MIQNEYNNARWGEKTMKRLLTERLEKWKNNPRRKPLLLLLGARQVGKTWPMLDFGKQHYKQVAYVRFDRHERMRQLFEESSFDMHEMLVNMQTHVGFKIAPGETLIILDEIQECAPAT